MEAVRFYFLDPRDLLGPFVILHVKGRKMTVWQEPALPPEVRTFKELDGILYVKYLFDGGASPNSLTLPTPFNKQELDEFIDIILIGEYKLEELPKKTYWKLLTTLANIRP